MVIFHGGVPPRYVVATIQRLKGLAADRVVPGVYIITPKSSDKCLQLSERNDKPLWYWSWVYGRGDAKIYPKDGKMAPNFSDPDMPAVATQYWLVCRHPKDTQCYTISSLYYGSFLGLYRGSFMDTKGLRQI
jgi:hypothetical protein